jgi:hypothetical protein
MASVPAPGAHSKPRSPAHHTFSFVEKALASIGFEPGAPAGVPAFALAIDKLCAAEMVCGSCGRKGLRWRPYHDTVGTYRALSVCPCGFAEEV